MTKAMAYIRCSGLGQMDGDGPTRQRLAIESYAAVHAIEIVRWFEESHTGSDLEGRAVFSQMRAELMEDGIRTVIVERLDRLARDIMIQETVIADFRKNGVILLSSTPGEENLCSQDPTRTLIRQILGCFFEYERKMIIRKLNEARERMRTETGRCEGVKPYGTFASEAATLHLMRELRDSGMCAQQIVLELQQCGRRTRTGKDWHPATVRKILARERIKAVRTTS